MKVALARLESPVRDVADAIGRVVQIYQQAVVDGVDLVVFPEFAVPKEEGTGPADSHLIFSRPDLDRLAVQTGPVALLVGCAVRPLPKDHQLQNSVAVFCLLDGEIQELESAAPRTQFMRYRGQVIETMLFRNCWLGQEQIHEYYRSDKLGILGATRALDCFEKVCFQGAVLDGTRKSPPLTAYWHLLQQNANAVSDSGTITGNVVHGPRQITSQGDACLIVDLVSRWSAILSVSSVGAKRDSSLILGCAAQLPIKIGNTEVVVEVLRTYLQFRTGMMFRGELSDDAGMLFVYRQPKRVSFYMRNTRLPLSCAYMNSEGVILEIHDMEPLSCTSIRSASEEIRFVLEVNRGWFARHEVDIASRMTINQSSPGDYFFET